jgi:diacylglycerol kinase (ATP)
MWSKLQIEHFYTIFVLNYFTLINSRILIIANPLAQGGKAQHTLDAYVIFLKNKGFAHYTYCTKGINDDAHVYKLLEIDSFDKVVILGGDGTINLAVNALPNLSIPVFIIPAGSGNDFAKMIYEKIDLENIFIRSIDPNLRNKKVDVWICNKRRFIHGFGAGFDGEIANQTIHNKTILPSKLKYTLEVAKQIFFYSSQLISVNGKELPTFMLSVANGRVYGGSFNVAPNADISDGQLDIIRIKKVYTAYRPFYLPLIIKGKHLGLSIVESSRANVVNISSVKRLPAHIDGEPLLEKTYTIEYEGQINILC